MKAPLSQNELIILDRQMGTVARQLEEIAALFETRLGEETDLARSARMVEQGFANLARKVHNRAASAEAGTGGSKSQTA